MYVCHSGEQPWWKRGHQLSDILTQCVCGGFTLCRPKIRVMGCVKNLGGPEPAGEGGYHSI